MSVPVVLLGRALCQTAGLQSTLNGLGAAGRRSYGERAMAVDVSVEIRINGEHRRVPVGLSLAGMLAEIGIDPKKVAVERNLEIVPRSNFSTVPVEDGDAYEIVHFVGGG
jgi:sulfur carrier protein